MIFDKEFFEFKNFVKEIIERKEQKEFFDL